jgi:hypothetical protein
MPESPIPLIIRQQKRTNKDGTNARAKYSILMHKKQNKKTGRRPIMSAVVPVKVDGQVDGWFHGVGFEESKGGRGKRRKEEGGRRKEEGGR